MDNLLGRITADITLLDSFDSITQQIENLAKPNVSIFCTSCLINSETGKLQATETIRGTDGITYSFNLTCNNCKSTIKMVLTHIN
jgi:hypothetical protein